MQIKDIRLLRSNFVLNSDLQESERIKNDIALNIRTGYDEDIKEITIILIAQTKGNDFFSFEIEYGGKFILANDDENDVERLCNINCPAIIFPFLREYVADLTRRAGLEPFHFGPVNFVKASENAKTN